MKRILTLVLVLLSIVFMFTTALAEDDSITRASDYFGSYGISLTSPGSGKVNFTMSCSAVGTASQLGVTSYNIQKYTSSGWVSVASGGSNYKYGVSSYALAKTFNGVSGEKYRVKCTFLCVKNGTAESKAYTSRTITAN